MFEGYIAGKFADKMFEEEVFQTIKKHAMVGALLMMIPDCGLGIIFFIAVLWHMYSSICDKVGISFSDHFWKLVGVGMMVNLLVVLISDIVFTVLFFLEGFSFLLDLALHSFLISLILLAKSFNFSLHFCNFWHSLHDFVGVYVSEFLGVGGGQTADCANSADNQFLHFLINFNCYYLKHFYLLITISELAEHL